MDEARNFRIGWLALALLVLGLLGPAGPARVASGAPSLAPSLEASR